MPKPTRKTVFILGMAFGKRCSDFYKIHETLRVMPAAQSGITDRVWELSDVIWLLDAQYEQSA
jgi:hypothetical protein